MQAYAYGVSAHWVDDLLPQGTLCDPLQRAGALLVLHAMSATYIPRAHADSAHMQTWPHTEPAHMQTPHVCDVRHMQTPRSWMPPSSWGLCPQNQGHASP